jgi:murein DD-endopeptidase MepM/ murein hydrolase activator NlpD
MPLPRRQRSAAALATLLALCLAVPALAQTADDLDEVHDQQDEANDRLDVLQADYADLEAALEHTNQQVREAEAAKRAAEQRLEAARREVQAANAAVVQMEQEIVVLQAQADEDAVNIYMNPEPQLVAMEADDLTTATRREALLSTIANQHGDVLDRLNGLQVDLVDAQARARQAADEVQAQRAEVQSRLTEYRTTQTEQQRLRGELDRRIDAVQQEVEDLADQEAELQAALAQASQAPTLPDGSPDVPPPSSGQLQWPTQGTITGVYGESRPGHMHAGIDIANAEGTPIVAAESGTIIGSCGSGYGNCILIDHGGGMVTLYAHQSSQVLTSGSVSRGQLVGYMGCTGSCTGPHLHFEVRINGSAVDPMGYL